MQSLLVSAKVVPILMFEVVVEGLGCKMNINEQCNNFLVNKLMLKLYTTL